MIRTYTFFFNRDKVKRGDSFSLKLNGITTSLLNQLQEFNAIVKTTSITYGDPLFGFNVLYEDNGRNEQIEEFLTKFTNLNDMV